MEGNVTNLRTLRMSCCSLSVSSSSSVGVVVSVAASWAV